VSVSVVIPTWNRAGTLARAIASAAAQGPAEVVVIDDASTDDTPSVVQQVQQHYSCVRYVRHDEKSDDWQEASAAVYPSLVGTHVVCMGADDALIHGCLEHIQAHSDAAVVFTDYYVCDTSNRVTHGVISGYTETTTLDPAATCDRIVHWQWPSETGIGAGIRREHLLWLADREFWCMGPWSDAIGYAAVAAMHGCTYVPQFGAVFTQDPAGYGAIGREGESRDHFYRRCREWVNATDLPKEVRRAMCVRRQVPYA